MFAVIKSQIPYQPNLLLSRPLTPLKKGTLCSLIYRPQNPAPANFVE